MVRGVPRALVVLGVFLPGLVLAARCRSGAVPAGFAFGHAVNLDPHGQLTLELTPAVARAMHQAGARQVRFGLVPPPGQQWTPKLLALYQKAIDAARGAGVTPIVEVGSEILHGSSPYDWNGPGSGAFQRRFTTLAVSLARQLKGVGAFELWNEPNVGKDDLGPWSPVDPSSPLSAVACPARCAFCEREGDRFVGYDRTYLRPEVFANLLAGFYAGTPHPPVTVVSGGLLADNQGIGTDYLAQVFASPAFQAWRKAHPGTFPLDRLGWHPYLDAGSLKNPPASNALRPGHLTKDATALHAFLAAHYGSAPVPPVQITEMGWDQANVLPETQAADVQRTLQEIGDSPWLSGIDFYKWQTGKGEGKGYGALDVSGKPNPWLHAFQEEEALPPCVSQVGGGGVAGINGWTGNNGSRDAITLGAAAAAAVGGSDRVGQPR